MLRYQISGSPFETVINFSEHPFDALIFVFVCLVAISWVWAAWRIANYFSKGRGRRSSSDVVQSNPWIRSSLFGVWKRWAFSAPLAVLFAIGGFLWLSQLFVDPGPEKELSGVVTYVRDGDTIEVNGVAIRLSKLDCAETGTLKGNQATLRMMQLAEGQSVFCTLSGRRSYDRWIGECVLLDGRRISEVMIEERMCRRWFNLTFR